MPNRVDEDVPNYCPKSIGWLAGRAGHLMGYIIEACRTGNFANLPAIITARVKAKPQAAYDRVERAFGWAVALARTMAGDFTYLRNEFPRRPKAPNQTQAPRRNPPKTPRGKIPYDRDRAFVRHIRHTFQTRPIKQIARRICAAIGVREGRDLWPKDLVQMDETPAQWSIRHYGPTPPWEPVIIFPRRVRTRRKKPAPTHEQSKPSALAPQPPPKPPAYHQRE
jgi:hypothetical protein